MELTEDKVYYMKLPEGILPGLNDGFLPVVEKALEQDYKKVKEVLYMKIIRRDGLYMLNIRTRPLEALLDSAVRKKLLDREDMIHAIADRLCVYCHINERNLKLLTLYNKPGSQEELFLKKAVEFVNVELQKDSDLKLRKIKLEELVVEKPKI